MVRTQSHQFPYVHHPTLSHMVMPAAARLSCVGRSQLANDRMDVLGMSKEEESQRMLHAESSSNTAWSLWSPMLLGTNVREAKRQDEVLPGRQTYKAWANQQLVLREHSVCSMLPYIEIHRPLHLSLAEYRSSSQ